MRITVIPGLILDDDLFERAAAGIRHYAPQAAPLTWERFVTPANWLNMPNDRDELSKSEMTLLNTPKRTLRLNVWHCADTRAATTSRCRTTTPGRRLSAACWPVATPKTAGSSTRLETCALTSACGTPALP